MRKYLARLTGQTITAKQFPPAHHRFWSKAARSQVAAVLGIPLLKGCEASHWIAATTAAQPPPVSARQDDGSGRSSANGERAGTGKARVEVKQAGGNSSSSSSSCGDAAAARHDGDTACTGAASRATCITGATARDSAAAARGMAATVANRSAAFDVTSCGAAASPAAPPAAAGSSEGVVYGRLGGEVSPTAAAACPTGRDAGLGGAPVAPVATTVVLPPESARRDATVAVNGQARTIPNGPVGTGEHRHHACGGKEAGALPVSQEVAASNGGKKRFMSSGVSCPRDSKKIAKGFSEHDAPHDSGGIAAVDHGSGGAGSSGAGADEAILSSTFSAGGHCKREQPAGEEGEQEEGKLPARTSKSAKRPKISSSTGLGHVLLPCSDA